MREKLKRLSRAAHEIAKHSYVGTVGADSTCVDRQTEPLGLIEIDTRVIQFRQAESLRGQHAVQSGRIHRPGRTMPLPWPSRQFIELLPIAFVPSRHSLLAARLVGPQRTRFRQNLVPSRRRLIQNYVNVAALDAVWLPLVASRYLMPAGKILYSGRARRHLKNSRSAC